jgi:hypothetical protein
MHPSWGGLPRPKCERIQRPHRHKQLLFAGGAGTYIIGRCF